MARCTHDNVEITELGASITTHLRNDDGSWDHDSDFGDYTGVIEVYCPDCEHKYRFGQRRPRWVEKFMAELDSQRIQDLYPGAHHAGQGGRHHEHEPYHPTGRKVQRTT